MPSLDNSTSVVVRTTSPSKPIEVAQGSPIQWMNGAGLDGSQGQGYLTPDEIGARVETLHTAIKRWNTDEDAIFNALALTTEGERSAIAAAYRERFGETLKDAISRVTSGGDRHLALALLEKGFVERVDLLKFATDRWFSDKQLIVSVFAGLSKAEIAALEKDWKAQGGGSLRDLAIKNLSGDEEFDALLALEGAPDTVEEMISQVDRRVAHERSGVGGFFIDLFSDKGTKLEETQRTLHQEYEKMRKDGTLGSATSQSRLVELTAGAMESATSYRALRDTVATWTREILATTALIVVSIAALAVSAPLWAVFLIAAGTSLLVRAGVNALFQGKGYGSDELMSDAGSAVVDGASALIPAASRGWVLARTAAMAEKTVLQCALKGAVQGAILGGISGGTREGFSSTLSAKTWNNGILVGLGEISTKTLKGIALGAVIGAPLGATQGALAKLAQPLQRGNLLSWVDGAKEKFFGGTRVMMEESGQLTFFSTVTKQLSSLSSSAGGIGSIVSALLGSDSKEGERKIQVAEIPMLVGAIFIPSTEVSGVVSERSIISRRERLIGKEASYKALPEVNQKKEQLQQLLDDPTRIHAHQHALAERLRVDKAASQNASFVVLGDNKQPDSIKNSNVIPESLINSRGGSQSLTSSNSSTSVVNALVDVETKKNISTAEQLTANKSKAGSGVLQGTNNADTQVANQVFFAQAGSRGSAVKQQVKEEISSSLQSASQGFKGELSVDKVSMQRELQSAISIAQPNKGLNGISPSISLENSSGVGVGQVKTMDITQQHGVINENSSIQARTSSVLNGRTLELASGNANEAIRSTASTQNLQTETYQVQRGQIQRERAQEVNIKDERINGVKNPASIMNEGSLSTNRSDLSTATKSFPNSISTDNTRSEDNNQYSGLSKEQGRDNAVPGYRSDKVKDKSAKDSGAAGLAAEELTAGPIAESPSSRSRSGRAIGIDETPSVRRLRPFEIFPFRKQEVLIGDEKTREEEGILADEILSEKDEPVTTDKAADDSLKSSRKKRAKKSKKSNPRNNRRMEALEIDWSQILFHSTGSRKAKSLNSEELEELESGIESVFEDQEDQISDNFGEETSKREIPSKVSNDNVSNDIEDKYSKDFLSQENKPKAV